MVENQPENDGTTNNKKGSLKTKARIATMNKQWQQLRRENRRQKRNYILKTRGTHEEGRGPGIWTKVTEGRSKQEAVCLTSSITLEM